MVNQNKHPHENQSLEQVVVSVKDVFSSHFGAKDYALIPHTNKLARWVFKYSVLLCAFLILSIVCISMVVILQAENTGNGSV